MPKCYFNFGTPSEKLEVLPGLQGQQSITQASVPIPITVLTRSLSCLRSPGAWQLLRGQGFGVKHSLVALTDLLCLLLCWQRAACVALPLYSQNSSAPHSPSKTCVLHGVCASPKGHSVEMLQGKYKSIQGQWAKKSKV